MIAVVLQYAQWLGSRVIDFYDTFQISFQSLRYGNYSNVREIFLNNPEYDENMKTRFGVIINLSPDFLFRLGKAEYIKRTGKLKEIFLKTRYPKTEQEKEIHNWLLKLESRYKMRILELPDSIPGEYEVYSKCW